MPPKQLKFNSITDLERAVSALFGNYLKACVKDCQGELRDELLRAELEHVTVLLGSP